MTALPTPGRVALLAPMRSELLPLVRSLQLRQAHSGDRTLHWGALGRVEVIATITGIGTRAAARTTERILDSVRPDHLLVVGIAGGIGHSVAIGDLVIPERVIDLASGSEYRPVPFGDTPARGTLVTSDDLLVDPAQVASLERQGVIAVDMETAAIAAVCERRACPWSVFRAISDRAADPSVDPAIFGLAGPDGSPDLRALARFLLTKPRSIPQLVHLARDARLAANTAAAAAIRALATR